MQNACIFLAAVKDGSPKITHMNNELQKIYPEPLMVRLWNIFIYTFEEKQDEWAQNNSLKLLASLPKTICKYRVCSLIFVCKNLS